MDTYPDDSIDYDFTTASNAENKNTKRKTETDMRIFSAYLISLNELRPIEALPPVELDRYLTTFFSVIKKHDGNEYEPASLRGMLCSVERYLRSRDYPSSVTRDAIFLNTRNMLKEKQKILREISKTQKKTKQESLTASTVERLKQLYNAKEFGPYSPTAIINSLCFAFVIHLKIRKAVDHKQMLWGDITLKRSGTTEYLCYEPMDGFDYIRPRLSGISQFRIYAQTTQDSSVDPIYIYKLYASKRPKTMMTPDSPFYLGIAVVCNSVPQQQQWFKPSPMGVNKLSDLVRMIRDITGSLSVIPADNFLVYDGQTVRPSDRKDEHSLKRLDTVVSTSSEDVDEVAQDYSIHGGHKDQTMTTTKEQKDDSGDEMETKQSTTSSTDGAKHSPRADHLKLDEIKRTITECIESLDDPDQTEMINWLSTLVDKYDRVRENDDKYLVTFSLTNSQLRRQTPLTLSASVMRYRPNNSRSVVSTNSKTRSPEDPDSLIRNETGKRRLSENELGENGDPGIDPDQYIEASSETTPKRRKQSQDDDESADNIHDSPEDTAARADTVQNDVTDDITDTCQQTSPAVLPAELPQDYVSMYTWPTMDPRVAALFMRQSLLASYRNIFNVDKSSNSNKPVE